MSDSSKPNIHTETPMFSDRLACGLRRKKGTHYVWGRRPTCKTCLKAWHRRHARGTRGRREER